MSDQEKKGFFRGLMERIGVVSDAEDKMVEHADGGDLAETAQLSSPSPQGGYRDKPGFFERLKNGLQKTKEGWLVALMRWCWVKRRLMPIRWRSWRRF
jgi:hypothetical protein